jgi:hypothetical protein
MGEPTELTDDRRAERWARAVVAGVALASAAPISCYVGAHSSSLRDDLVDLGRQLAEDGTAREQLEQGASMASAGALAIGAVCFGVLMLTRRRRTRRLVDEAIRAGRWEPTSPALLITTAAWAALLAAVAFAGVPQFVAAREVGELAERFGRQPVWMLLVVPGLALATAMSTFVHRRREEIAPLKAAGLVELPAPEPPDVGVTGFVGGLRAFVWAAVLGSVLALGDLVDASLGDEEIDLADHAGAWMASVVIVPAVVAGVFLVTLALTTPTRWMVRAALRQPVTIASLGLIAGSLVLAAIESVPAALPIAMILVGGLLGAVTSLYTQDLGPQPWLGILFLIFTYSFDLTNDAGDVSLPTSVVGWVAALGAAAYAIREGAAHWRGTYAAPVAVVRNPTSAGLDPPAF